MRAGGEHLLLRTSVSLIPLKRYEIDSSWWVGMMSHLHSFNENRHWICAFLQTSNLSNKFLIPLITAPYLGRLHWAGKKQHDVSRSPCWFLHSTIPHLSRASQFLDFYDLRSGSFPHIFISPNVLRFLECSSPSMQGIACPRNPVKHQSIPTFLRRGRPIRPDSQGPLTSKPNAKLKMHGRGNATHVLLWTLGCSCCVDQRLFQATSKMRV